MVEGKEGRGGRSLEETPSWALATVVAVQVTLGCFFHHLLKMFGKWLDRTQKKALRSAFEKIKEELMLFGLLSLLMGHWIIYMAKICVKSSVLRNSKFYPCLPETGRRDSEFANHVPISVFNHLNSSVIRKELDNFHRQFCPEGSESLASYESLEQLHRFLFVLGITHIFYSFIAIALASTKIYSWRTWENQAKSMALQEVRGSPQASSHGTMRVSTFVSRRTSHPWSQHKVLVWPLCFSRQFLSSINRADYMALRLGFITAHQLPLSYDFHNYMIRSMVEEFCDIVGISVPLWIFAILCIFLGFHGTNLYIWLSFLPAVVILVISTKLHTVVVKLAAETDALVHNFNPRDELFWFGKPRLLLRLIQFISFQNAFEMAMFVWSLWETEGLFCFMDERGSFIVIRLTFGLLSQVWCSFFTFPLYVIVTQMGSTFKKSIISENVRRLLRRWKNRVNSKDSGPSFVPLSELMLTLSSNLDSEADKIERCIDQLDTSDFYEDTFGVENQNIQKIHE